MFRLLVLCALSCTAESRLRKPSGSDVAEKIEAVEVKSTPVFKKVAEQMKLVAEELEKGMSNKNKTMATETLKKATSSVADVKKEFEAVKKEFDAAVGEKKEKFPWWANATAENMPNLTQTKTEKVEKFPWWANASAGNMPNLTQTKTEKAPKDNKDEKFPYWADAMPNLTQTKTEKAPKDKKDEKFPYWADAMPNLTQTKTEKAPKEKKDEKFPWWANASSGTMPNFTQITKDLPKNIPKGQPTFADLGPFESKEAACDYCFTSHTKSSVVPNCICTAYDADDGPTMFCTASAAGVKWVAEKGGCKCVEKNPTAMGETTCDPF